mmetsp:Transcript_18255/g.17377  ORF Transcript_18255/g.17377 Transcript_18255/m.17377 type:complete len:84 (+) Transcript_18255:105-356(+)
MNSSTLQDSNINTKVNKTKTKPNNNTTLLTSVADFPNSILNINNQNTSTQASPSKKRLKQKINQVGSRQGSFLEEVTKSKKHS